MKSIDEQIGISGGNSLEPAISQGKYLQGRNLSFIFLLFGWLVSGVLFISGCVLIFETYVGVTLICVSLFVGLSSTLLAKIINAHFDIADNIQSIKEQLVTSRDGISK